MGYISEYIRFTPYSIIKTLAVLCFIVFASLIFALYFKHKYSTYRTENTRVTETLHKIVFALMSFVSVYSAFSCVVKSDNGLYYLVADIMECVSNSLTVFFVFLIVLLFAKGRYRYEIRAVDLITPTILNVCSLIAMGLTALILKTAARYFNIGMILNYLVFFIAAIIFHIFAKSKYQKSIRRSRRRRENKSFVR